MKPVRRSRGVQVIMALSAFVQITAAASASAEDDLLAIMQQASTASTEGVRSLIGSAIFERTTQGKEDAQPTLMSKARVKVFCDRDKYHLQYDYEVDMITVRLDGDPKTDKLVDSKPDKLYAIFDGNTALTVRFSVRTRPVGCEADIFSSLAETHRGFRKNDAARLGAETMNLPKAVENIGAANITVTKSPEGLLTSKYVVENAPNVHVEFTADPAVGNNITEVRVYNDVETLPAHSHSIKWKSIDDVWFAEELVEIQDRRRVQKDGNIGRITFRFEDVKLNCEVDPDLFKRESTGYPQGTRFIDRRPGAPRP